MSVTFSGSLDITGSLFVNGTAVSTGSGGTVDTGSLLVTASISDATTTYTKGDGSTFALTVNNVSNASTASIATSASFATTALTASYALTTDLGTSATASFTGSTWTFDHNLNQQYVLIAAYDSSDNAIIPQTVNLTSANQAVITFPTSVQGVAVASLGNGVTSGGGSSGFNPNTNFYNLVNNREANTVQTLNANAGGVFNLHISASGLHKIDCSTMGTTSASINAYFYPDSFTTSGSQAAFWLTLSSGSGNVLLRTMISSSAGTYFAPSASPGNTTATTMRNATLPILQMGGGALAAPSIFTVMSDGTKMFGFSQSPFNTSNNFQLSGNFGTPLT